MAAHTTKTTAPASPQAALPSPALLGAGAVAIAILAAALLLHFRRKRFLSRVARKARTRYPIVLAHGFLGFDEIKIGGESHQYFRGVGERLTEEGCIVHRPRVSKVASISSRAEDFANFIREIDAPKVNVIAHSMGGLDARLAIAKLGLQEKISSLVTIGTPHRGTPLADIRKGMATLLKVTSALEVAGFDFNAIKDLGTERMQRFNEEVPDAATVDYLSIVATVRSKFDINPLLWVPHAWLTSKAGENDGIVPAASQSWGHVLRQVQADHWALIGWSRSFDAAELYVDISRELRARGH